MTPTCPYCRTPFEPDDEVVACATCGTNHHADCLQENGGCTVFGCASGPVDEPKINVTSVELARPVSAAAAPPPGPAPPPPRRAGAPPPPPLPGMPMVRIAAPQPSPPQQTFGFGGYNAPAAAPVSYSRYVTRKSRVAYVLLAIFFGALGIHNFYAGYIKKAVIQCCITVLTCFWGSLIVWIWAIVEACRVEQDEDGVAFN